MKNRKSRALLSGVLICAMLLSACGNGGAVSGSSASDEAAATLGYVSEIDKSSIMSVSVTADPEEWQAMLDNAEAEEYIPADVTINGTTIKNVGIRPKGNSSLSSIARDDETDRYSFKISFDEYVDGQTWLGLDKLVLNSNYSDASSMKEYLSYDVMSYIGVDAPLFAYADIEVNSKSWGFYLAIEEIDGSYKQRVKNDEGELYKPESMEMGGGMGRPTGAAVTGSGLNNQAGNPPPQQPAGNGDRMQGGFGGGMQGNFDGRMQGGFGGGMNAANGGVSLVYTDDNSESYSAIFDNAETKTDESDHQRVVEAIKNLNSGTGLETYIDVDSVLRYLAAHTVVVNLDSYSGSMGHNYLLYENDGQISILPWDYNMAFGGFQSGDASNVVNLPIDTPVSGVNMEDRPLISKLLEVPEYLETYHQYLQEIIDGYFADGKFEQTVDELNTLISAHIENDPSAFYTYAEYQAAVTELKELGTLRAESIQGQLDGTVPSTSEGQTAEPDKLIDASSVDMSALGSMGGGMGGFGGGGGQMPNGPEGLSRETMGQAMEIIRSATNGQLTEDQKSQLRDLGLSDEQIEQMLAMPAGGGFGERNNPS